MLSDLLHQETVITAPMGSISPTGKHLGRCNLLAKRARGADLGAQMQVKLYLTASK